MDFSNPFKNIKKDGYRKDPSGFGRINAQDLKNTGSMTDPIAAGVYHQAEKNLYGVIGETADLEKYTEHHIGPSNHIDMEKELIKAQGAFTKIGNALAQTVVSELALGTIKGITDLVDVVGHTIGLSDDDYTNPVSETLEKWQEDFRNYAAIHTDPDKNISNGGLSDVSWWASNMPSVISSLTLLIPSTGVVKLAKLAKIGKIGSFTAKTVKSMAGVGKKLKAAQIAREAGKSAEEVAKIGKLNKFQKWLVKPSTTAQVNLFMENTATAALSRTMENYQEARGTYSDMYDEAKDKFKDMSDEEYDAVVKANQALIQKRGIDPNNRDAMAKAIASEAADVTFQLDWQNMIFDVIEMYGLKDAWKGLKNAPESSAAIRRANRDAAKYLGKTSEEIAKIKKARPWYKKAGERVGDFLVGSKMAVAGQLSEGIEESVNYMATEEGMYFGRILLEGNLNEERDSVNPGFLSNIANLWDKRAWSYMKAPELWDSAFWGVAGGVIFQAGGNKLNRISYNIKNRKNRNSDTENAKKALPWYGLDQLPETKRRLAEINAREKDFEEYKRQLDLIHKGIDPVASANAGEEVHFTSEAEAQIRIEELQQRMIQNMTMRAMQTGNFDLLKTYLQNDNLRKSLVEMGIFDERNDTRSAAEKEMQAKQFTDRAIRLMEETEQAYAEELETVNNAAGLISDDMRTADQSLPPELRRKKKRELIPAEYIQIIARNNMEHRIQGKAYQTALAGVNARIAELKSMLAEGKSSDLSGGGGGDDGKGSLDPNIDYQQAQKLLQVSMRLGQLRAARKSIMQSGEKTLSNAIALNNIDRQISMLESTLSTEELVLATGYSLRFTEELGIDENGKPKKGFVDLGNTQEYLDYLTYMGLRSDPNADVTALEKRLREELGLSLDATDSARFNDTSNGIRGAFDVLDQNVKVVWGTGDKSIRKISPELADLMQEKAALEIQLGFNQDGIARTYDEVNRELAILDNTMNEAVMEANNKATDIVVDMTGKYGKETMDDVLWAALRTGIESDAFDTAMQKIDEADKADLTDALRLIELRSDQSNGEFAESLRRILFAAEAIKNRQAHPSGNTDNNASDGSDLSGGGGGDNGNGQSPTPPQTPSAPTNPTTPTNPTAPQSPQSPQNPATPNTKPDGFDDVVSVNGVDYNYKEQREYYLDVDNNRLISRDDLNGKSLHSGFYTKYVVYEDAQGNEVLVPIDTNARYADYDPSMSQDERNNAGIDKLAKRAILSIDSDGKINVLQRAYFQKDSITSSPVGETDNGNPLTGDSGQAPQSPQTPTAPSADEDFDARGRLSVLLLEEARTFLSEGRSDLTYLHDRLQAVAGLWCDLQLDRLERSEAERQAAQLVSSIEKRVARRVSQPDSAEAQMDSSIEEVIAAQTGLLNSDITEERKSTPAAKAYKAAVNRMLNVYVKNLGLKKRGEKTYIVLENLLRYINEVEADPTMAHIMYSSLAAYLETDEAKEHFIAIDEDTFRRGDFLKDVAMTEQERAAAMQERYDQVQLDTVTEANSAELDGRIDEWADAMNNLDAGDELSVSVLNDFTVQFSDSQGRVVARIARPSVNERGNLVYNREGWKYELTANNSGSGMYDFLSQIINNPNPHYQTLQNALYELAFGKPNAERIKKLLEDIKNNRAFDLATSTLLEQGANVDNAINHLVKLFQYLGKRPTSLAASAVTTQSIDEWFDKLRTSAETSAKLIRQDGKNVKVTVRTITRGELIKATESTNRAEEEKAANLIQDAVGDELRNKDGSIDYNKVKIGVGGQDSTMTVAGKGSLSRRAVGRGTTYVVIYPKAGTPLLATAMLPKIGEATGAAKEIVDAIAQRIIDLPSNERAKFIKQVFDVNHGQNATLFYGVTCTTTAKGTTIVGVGDNVFAISKTGMIIGGKRGERWSALKGDIKAQITKVLANASFGASFAYVKSDNATTYVMNGIAQKKNGKFVITVGSKKWEFNSYNEFMLSNNLIKVNMAKSENGKSNFRVGKGRLAQTNLGVSMEFSTPVGKNEQGGAKPPAIPPTGKPMKERLSARFKDGKAVSGNTLVREMVGSMEGLTQSFAKAIKELGILPENIVFDEHYNDNRNTNATANVKTGQVVVGKKWLELAANPATRMEAIRKLIHEGLHLKLAEKDKQNTLDSIKQIYEEFKKAIEDGRLEAGLKAAGKNPNMEQMKKYLFNGMEDMRALEEFLVESLTSEELATALNSVQVDNKGFRKKSNLLTWLLEKLAKLFGWDVKKGSLYERELRTLRSEFKAPTTGKAKTKTTRSKTTITKRDGKTITTTTETKDGKTTITTTVTKDGKVISTTTKEKAEQGSLFGEEELKGGGSGDGGDGSSSGSITPQPATTAQEKAQQAIDKIVDDGTKINLSADEKVYFDETERKLGVRTTTAIQAATENVDEETGQPKRFDPTSAWITPSTNIGTGVDEFVRDFFLGRLDSLSEEELEKLYPNATGQMWREFKEQLDEFKEQMENGQLPLCKGKKLTVVSRDIKAVGDVEITMPDGSKKSLHIAGTLDLIAYDQDGKFYIFDMKTMHNEDAPKWNTAKWSRQLQIYKQLLEKKYGIEVAETFIIPIKVEYETPKGATDFQGNDAGGTTEYTVANPEEKTNYDNPNRTQLLENGVEFRGAAPRFTHWGTNLRMKPKPFEIKYEYLDDTAKKLVDGEYTYDNYGKEGIEETPATDSPTGKIDDTRSDKEFGEGAEIDTSGMFGDDEFFSAITEEGLTETVPNVDALAARLSLDAQKTFNEMVDEGRIEVTCH